MDKRLEEQLERVRQLSARVAHIHEQLAQNTELLTRDREHGTGWPLHEVRDVPSWSHSHPSGASRRTAHHREPQAQVSDRPRLRRRK